MDEPDVDENQIEAYGTGRALIRFGIWFPELHLPTRHQTGYAQRVWTEASYN